jgi:hypothetical protein
MFSCFVILVVMYLKLKRTDATELGHFFWILIAVTLKYIMHSEWTTNSRHGNAQLDSMMHTIFNKISNNLNVFFSASTS